uniref:V-SNARE coiled-coil homology domain-containing protein n=1 Tax=Panagrolaimus sp. JU765 TaxID=591449 RepID=A0AC34QQY3_9BILA
MFFSCHLQNGNKLIKAVVTDCYFLLPQFKMDRARKKIASAIDGIRNNLHMRVELEVEERISSENCCLTKIVRHGFPDDSKCLAFDSVQKLIAIGAGNGLVRLMGKVGVDYLLKHESNEPVLFAAFLINEGGLVTVQRDDTVHLWNYRQKIPEIVHSMQMSKERITCICLPFQSKWLYLGTDKGNVYFVCLANFELSTYVINWNKAIDLSCRIHPGAVKHLSVCPTESHKLLIGFEKSHVCLWNLQTKEAEQFAVGQPQIKCVAWHYDATEPQQKINPHSSSTNCKPITHLFWHHNAEGEQLVIFVGGLPAEDGVLPAVSIMRGRPTKSTIVAEMDHQIVGICALNASPFNNIPQHPYALAVLLKSDFLVIDLNSQEFCCFENPNPMDIHESPVSFINYYSDCPVDLIAALTLVGRNQRKQGVKLSDKQWPITGGVGRDCATGHQEMLLTGHEDGSIKFWQASSENLQIMYKLKTGRHFEKIDENRLVSHAITNVELCLDSRLLLVAGSSGQVTLFRFVKTESCQDISVIALPQLCTSNGAPTTPTFDDDLKSAAKELRRQLETSESKESVSTATSSGGEATEQTPIKVRGGSMRRPAGYQPELVCMIPWTDGQTPEKITAMTLNSAYGVLAIGTAAGMALVDMVSYTAIYSWTTTELCGREPIQLNPPPPDASPSEPPTPTVFIHPEESRAFGIGLFRRATLDMKTPPKKLTKKFSFAAGSLEHRRSKISTDEEVSSLAVDTEAKARPETLQLSSAPSPEKLPSRSHSVKKIVRRVTDRLIRAKSVQAPAEEVEPVELAQDTMHSSVSPIIPNSSKNFMRLNTEKSRSVDRRPILAKAQSIAASAAAMMTSGSNAASELNSPSFSRDEFSNGEQKNQNGGSRSSSTTSLEKIDPIPECVTSLSFISIASKRGNSKSDPCLWLGMSTGAITAFVLQLPVDRITSSVIAAPSGSVVRLQDRILCTAFMDRNMCLIVGATESYKDPTKDSAPTSANLEKAFQNKVLTRASFSPTTNPEVGLPSPEELAHLAIFVSEYDIKVVALPSYQQIYVHRPDIPLVKARTTHIRGFPVLICLSAAGNVVIFSLPSLRPLFQQPLFKGSVEYDDPICQKTEFSEHGLGMYMASPSELQKFTVCSDLASQVDDCAGELFVPVDMPEPPKTSFLKGVSTLFAGQKEAIDVDTILAEKPSTAAVVGMKSIARPIPVNNMDPINSKNVSAGQAAMQALQNLNERGERLQNVIDATENLRNNAVNLQSRSKALVEKYEKKKWYQL